MIGIILKINKNNKYKKTKITIKIYQEIIIKKKQQTTNIKIK